MNTLSAESVLNKLRSQTQDAHKALEATPLSIKLMSPDITRESYMQYLQRMQPVIAFYEQQVYPALTNIVPDIAKRNKLHWMNQDMQILNADKPATFSFQPVIKNSAAYALGSMYVIEGSTLGGKMIAKHVEKILGFNSETGASFFGGYGAETGVLWKSFLQTMCDYTVANNAEDELIEGAVDTFKAIQKHFEK